MRKLKKTVVFLMSLALVLGMGSVRAAAAESTLADQAAVEYRQTMARDVVPYVNQLRTSGSWQWDETDTTQVNVPAMGELTYDYTLEQIAMQRAAELVQSFSHTRPNGEDCFTAFTGGFASWSAMGENIAYGQRSAEEVYNAWLEENEKYAGQGHRRNMLGNKFTAIGMGCVYYNGTLYWAMELGTPTGEFNVVDPGVDDGGSTPPSGDEGGSTPGAGEGGDTSGADEGEASSGDSENHESASDDSSDSDDGSGSDNRAVVNVDWNTVNNNLSSALKASNAQDIVFAVGDSTEIPVDILSQLAGSKATLALQSGSGLTVTVSGRDVKKVSSTLTVSISGSVNIPDSVKQKVVTDNASSREFTIGDPGTYPIAVHMNLGKANAGKKAILYYYDEAKGTMKSMGSFTITESGQAMFGVRRGGQYIAVVSGQSVQNGGNYTVVSGDTLYSIAKKGGVSFKTLREANPQITNLNKIYPGQKINIP